MLLTLLAWIYISGVSLAWGHLVLRLLTRYTDIAANSIHLIPTLFTGMAFTGIVCFYLSLILPMSLLVQMLIAVPAAIFYFFPFNRRLVKEQMVRLSTNFSTVVFFLAAAACFMVLLISTYDIIHPDTVAYHAQAILWMEEHKALAGLVYLDIELGIQSWWYAVMALYRFSFIESHPYLFTNGCIACWLLVFLSEQLGKNLINKKPTQFISWLLLFLFVMISWTQVRLTAASASPDFIATIYTWGAFYWFAGSSPENRSQFFLLAIFFSCAAIGIKLSVSMVLLIPAIIVVMLLIKKQYKAATLSAAAGAVIIAPTIIRNLIATGYPFFPGLIADFFSLPWKPAPEALVEWQHYITAYARMEAESYAAAEIIVQQPLWQWVPVWWNHLAVIDQLMLSLLMLLLVIYMVTIRFQLRRASCKDIIILFISLSGCVFWFMLAPDPRFGTGFLIPLIYKLAGGVKVLIPIKRADLKIPIYRAGLIVAVFAIIAYNGHRLIHYFDRGQWLLPKGVTPISYTSASCKDTHINIPNSFSPCGFTPVPCTTKTCDSLMQLLQLPDMEHHP